MNNSAQNYSYPLSSLPPVANRPKSPKRRGYPSLSTYPPPSIPLPRRPIPDVLEDATSRLAENILREERAEEIKILIAYFPVHGPNSILTGLSESQLKYLCKVLDGKGEASNKGSDLRRAVGVIKDRLNPSPSAKEAGSPFTYLPSISFAIWMQYIWGIHPNIEELEHMVERSECNISPIFQALVSSIKTTLEEPLDFELKLLCLRVLQSRYQRVQERLREEKYNVLSLKKQLSEEFRLLNVVWHLGQLSASNMKAVEVVTYVDDETQRSLDRLGMRGPRDGDALEDVVAEEQMFYDLTFDALSLDEGLMSDMMLIAKGFADVSNNHIYIPVAMALKNWHNRDESLLPGKILCGVGIREFMDAQENALPYMSFLLNPGSQYTHPFGRAYHQIACYRTPQRARSLPESEKTLAVAQEVSHRLHERNVRELELARRRKTIFGFLRSVFNRVLNHIAGCLLYCADDDDSATL